MSIQRLAWAFEVEGISAPQKLVLLALADHSNDGGHCWPSIDRLAQRTCQNRVTVIRCIEALLSVGLLTAEKASGKVTRYTLNPGTDPVHKVTGDQLQRVTGNSAQPVAESNRTRCREQPDQLQRATAPVKNHQ